MKPWANTPASMVINRKPPASLALTRGDMSASRPMVAVAFILVSPPANAISSGMLAVLS